MGQQVIAILPIRQARQILTMQTLRAMIQMRRQVLVIQQPIHLKELWNLLKHHYQRLMHGRYVFISKLIHMCRATFIYTFWRFITSIENERRITKKQQQKTKSICQWIFHLTFTVNTWNLIRFGKDIFSCLHMRFIFGACELLPIQLMQCTNDFSLN